MKLELKRRLFALNVVEMAARLEPLRAHVTFVGDEERFNKLLDLLSAKL